MATGEVLLLEDEAIIAMDIEMTLQASGYSVLGPYRSMQDAQEILEKRRPNVAILDVNLGNGETSFPLAEQLNRLGVPVVFLSGYSAKIVPAPAALETAPRLSKPVQERDLLMAIERAIAQ